MHYLELSGSESFGKLLEGTEFPQTFKRDLYTVQQSELTRLSRHHYHQFFVSSSHLHDFYVLESHTAWI